MLVVEERLNTSNPNPEACSPPATSALVLSTFSAWKSVRPLQRTNALHTAPISLLQTPMITGQRGTS